MVKVLLVDDRLESATAMRSFLLSRGYECELARSGAEAFSKLPQNRWDVLITDLELGDSNGLKVLAECKRVTPATVVLLMAEYATLNWALQAIHFGATSLLVKPCMFEQLDAQIQVALRLCGKS